MDVTKNLQQIIKGFTCGHCGVQSGYAIKFAQAEWDDEPWPYSVPGKAFVVVQCYNCKLLNLFIFDVQCNEFPTPCSNEFELGNYLVKYPETVNYTWDPSEGIHPTWIEYQGQYPNGHKISKSIPDEIRQALSEASNCLSVGASNAAVLMSRCVVERLASHLDSDSDNRNRLADVLKEIRRREVVSDNIFQALFEIKDWGNIVAHQKDRPPIDMKEARKVVDFVFQVVAEIFPQSSSMLDDGLKELRKLRQKKAR